MKRRHLTPSILTGLCHMHKYRFLTISQFAAIANLTVHHVAEVLRDLERWRLIGYFGFTSIPGHGKTHVRGFWTDALNSADFSAGCGGRIPGVCLGIFRAWRGLGNAQNELRR